VVGQLGIMAAQWALLFGLGMGDKILFKTDIFVKCAGGGNYTVAG
jgi:hypothetical protein